MTDITSQREQLMNNLNKVTKKSMLEDREILEWCRPFAEKLEIEVEELVLNLHSQGIFEFEDVGTLVGIDYQGE